MRSRHSHARTPVTCDTPTLAQQGLLWALKYALSSLYRTVVIYGFVLCA